MKKYELDSLLEAYNVLNNLESGDATNPVIVDYISKVKDEIKKRQTPKFVKATDKYLETLEPDDVYTRLLSPKDDHYYNGMYGLFEKKTGKLLRRHTDTGFLLLPSVKRAIGKL